LGVAAELRVECGLPDFFGAAERTDSHGTHGCGKLDLFLPWILHKLSLLGLQLIYSKISSGNLHLSGPEAVIETGNLKLETGGEKTELGHIRVSSFKYQVSSFHLRV
jgi:hypothetical protein